MVLKEVGVRHLPIEESGRQLSRGLYTCPSWVFRTECFELRLCIVPIVRHSLVQLLDRIESRSVEVAGDTTRTN